MLPISLHNIPNFAEVRTAGLGLNIYRGGQPSGKDWGFLKSIGVNQVIKLNQDSDGPDDMWLPSTLFKVPFGFIEQVFTEPDRQSLVDAVGFIQSGTFIHCTHGEDRTGLVIGLYRIWRCNWSKESAYAEMLVRGFHPMLLGLAKAWADAKPIGAGGAHEVTEYFAR